MTKKYDLAIIGGGGHVGLPLAVKFAEKGLSVLIIDVNQKVVDNINHGILTFEEENMEPIFKKVVSEGKLTATLDKELLKDIDQTIFIIGTPVDEHLNPKTKFFLDAVNSYFPYLKENSLFILRSTVYPGLSHKVAKMMEIKKIQTVFAPERILEGKAMEELETLPQIIASPNQKSLDQASKLFNQIASEILPTNKFEEAELAKLYSNVWRYIKFAVPNQFFMIANNKNLDFYKIYDLMTHNYSRNQDLPKPGFAAGPCLFKDAMQLGSYNESPTYIGDEAMKINEFMPQYIIDKLHHKYDLSDKTVGILGMSFKKNSDDIRESLSYKLKKLLLPYAQNILTSDPFVPKNVDSDLIETDQLISESDVIIIATPHTQYRDLKFSSDKIVVDFWNIFGQGCLI